MAWMYSVAFNVAFNTLCKATVPAFEETQKSFGPLVSQSVSEYRSFVVYLV